MPKIYVASGGGAGGGGGGNQVQRKILSANVTSSIASIADLEYNDLIIGKEYSIMFHYYFRETVTGTSYGVEIYPQHDGVQFAALRYIGDGEAGRNVEFKNAWGPVKFTATTTSLTFRFTKFYGNMILDGNNTRRHTYVELTQSDDTEVGSFT